MNYVEFILLQALSWDLESAVSLYVGQEIQEEQPEPSNRQNLSSFVSLPSMQDHDHRMGGIPSPPRMEETQIADKIMKNLLAAQHISSGAVNYGGVEFGGYADSDDDLRKVDEYDEQGVRRPDPVKQQVLLGGRFMREEDDEDILARAEDSSVEWLFDPPRHLSSLGNLEQVCRKFKMLPILSLSFFCRQELWLVIKRDGWLLIFSHILNFLLICSIETLGQMKQ